MDRYEYEAPTMGTYLKVALYAATQADAQRAIDASLQEIDRLIPILNNYDPQSEISRIVHLVDRPQGISPDLAAVLSEARRWYDLSLQRFDVTLGPLTQLWSRARRNRELPSEVDLNAARQHCGWDKIDLQLGSDQDEGASTITIHQTGMRIDVSGIATGYIIDRAKQAFQQHGAEAFLLDIGGDIAVGAPPPHAPGWKIDVAGIASSTPIRRLHLSHCAITSSGDLNQYVVIDGKRYSHLIDPRNGHPLERRQSVSVIGKTALDADAGATALCVLGMLAASQVFDALPLDQAFLLETGGDEGSRTTDDIRFRHLVAQRPAD